MPLYGYFSEPMKTRLSGDIELLVMNESNARLTALKCVDNHYH